MKLFILLLFFCSACCENIVDTSSENNFEGTYFSTIPEISLSVIKYDSVYSVTLCKQVRKLFTFEDRLIEGAFDKRFEVDEYCRLKLLFQNDVARGFLEKYNSKNEIEKIKIKFIR